MQDTSQIIIKGLSQNNLKNISFEIPKNKIVVFTGVSGSGKSSIVFDTVAAESSRQMNETYTAFVRGRLPKYRKPKVDRIEYLTPSVIVDQTCLGGNCRSTVGTISDMYSSLRLLFSRIGQPHVGSASYFSFNDPNGMCPECAGIGKKTIINIEGLLDKEKSWNEGCVCDSMFNSGSWYWQQYADSGLFDVDKKLKDYSTEEYNLLVYGNRTGEGERENKHIEGIFHQYTRYFLKRDLSNMSSHHKEKSAKLVKETDCPLCHGKRLSQAALSCRIGGYTITDMCEMEFAQLRDVLREVKDSRVSEVLDALCNSLTRMIEIGLPYLNMNRESATLSGGEAQRLKLVRYMGSSLTGMTYIFDEPSTGMHPRDVYRMNHLLTELRDKGNTVLVVEHDKDVISIADYVIDVGPLAGENGGTIVFKGSYENLLLADTLTAKAMKINLPIKEAVRKPTGFLPVRGATLHNLKNVDVDIPLGVMCIITGVAGSGKSSLISSVFASEYEEQVIKVDQSAIMATNRSMPATFLGIFDEIRKLFADENKVDASLFSFNSAGACPVCQGKGVVVTELVFMDPIVTECEACEGTRYSKEALSYTYKGKNMIEVLNMTASEALTFFESNRIKKALLAMQEVGLSYLTLGQPTSTLSGGERQRLKLAKHMNKKGNIYLLDEPTTGLHPSDIEKLLQLFERMVNKGNTVLIIEHNLDVVKRADYVIDVGPDGGKNGGQVVFCGTPKEMYDAESTITGKCLRLSVDECSLSEQKLREYLRAEI